LANAKKWFCCCSRLARTFVANQRRLHLLVPLCSGRKVVEVTNKSSSSLTAPWPRSDDIENLKVFRRSWGGGNRRHSPLFDPTSSDQQLTDSKPFANIQLIDNRNPIGRLMLANKSTTAIQFIDNWHPIDR
jgi:hypothetical protein